MKILFMKHVAWYLVIALFIISIVPRADAGLAPSEVVTLAEIDRNADIEKIQQVLEKKALKERLLQLGLTKDEIQKRLNQLSDQQIHQIALQLDNLKVGGDAVGIIIALLIIAILVILILQLTGHRVIVS